MIRGEEKENGGIFDNWSKRDHRIFNAKLWNCANKILETMQENAIMMRQLREIPRTGKLMLE